MDKEAVTYQLLQYGLIARGEMAVPTEANVETLNEWATLVGVGITFFLEKSEIRWILT